MGVVEQSQKAVEANLSELDDAFGSFPVNQTTVAVPVDEYRRERERADRGCVDLYARVENDAAEVLHVENDDELMLPWTRTTEETIERAAADAVAEKTGVSCRLDEVQHATILGVHPSDAEDDAVYRLAVVFEGVPVSGSTNTDAVWHATTEVPEILTP